MIVILQLTALASLFGVGLWRRMRDPAEIICALLLLIWTDLVFTGLLLSCFRQLGNGRLHIAVSLLPAATTAWLIRLDRSAILPRPTDEDGLSCFSHGVAWLAILLAIRSTPRWHTSPSPCMGSVVPG